MKPSVCMLHRAVLLVLLAVLLAGLVFPSPVRAAGGGPFDDAVSAKPFDPDDPEVRGYVEDYQRQLMNRANGLFREILAESGSTQIYLLRQERSRENFLAQREKLENEYGGKLINAETPLDLGSLVYSSALAGVKEGLKGAAKEAVSFLLGVGIDEAKKALKMGIEDIVHLFYDGALSKKDFIVSQSVYGEQNLRLDEMEVLLTRAAQNDGVFSTPEDAIAFLECHQQNRLALRTMQLADDYYRELMNRNPFERFLDASEEILLSAAVTAFNTVFLDGHWASGYVLDEVVKAFFHYLDHLATAFNDPVIRQWEEDLYAIRGDTFALFSFDTSELEDWERIKADRAGWTRTWVMRDQPEHTLDISLNYNATLHLEAHFEGIGDYSCDFTPEMDLKSAWFQDTVRDLMGTLVLSSSKEELSAYLVTGREASGSDPIYPFLSRQQAGGPFLNELIYVPAPPGEDRDDGPKADAAVRLSPEETQRLITFLSRHPLLAASGAGAWEGRLLVNADGTFTGSYYDEDADGISEVSFQGAFGPSAERIGNVYHLLVEDLTLRNPPGTPAVSVYGDPIVYADAPIHPQEVLVLTLPGTPDEDIPDTVRAEIGGVFGEWEDYSRFCTLTRLEDGWGFFTDGSVQWSLSDLEPTATAAPDPAPGASRGGEVLIDDELCTVVNLGKEMFPTIGNGIPLPGYRLAVTNHLDRKLVFYADTYREAVYGYERTGKVNGLVLSDLLCGDLKLQLSPNRLEVPPGETGEMYLAPIGYGRGFSSPEELVNVDLFIHAVYDDPAERYRDYELRLDFGAPYLYPDAKGYTFVTCAAFGISFELPENWTTFYITGQGVSPQEPENFDFVDLLRALNPPTLYDNGILISSHPMHTLEQAVEMYLEVPDAQPAEDLLIDGHRACMIRSSSYDRYGRILVERDDGLVLNLWFGEVYKESGYLAAIEHFLRTFRFQTGQDAAREKGTPEEESGTAVSWPGIWRSRGRDADSWLYVFPYDWGEGVYDTILTSERDGSFLAVEGMLYPVDGITEEFYSEGCLHAGLVQTLESGTITLTPFSALSDGLLPWMDALEADYVYVCPLEDPDSQIPPAVWERLHGAPAGSPVPSGPTQVPVMDSLKDIPVGIGPTPDSGRVVHGYVPSPLLSPTPAPAPSVHLDPIPGAPGVLQVPVLNADATSWLVSSRDPNAYLPLRMLDGEETTSFQFSTDTTPLGQACLTFAFEGPVTLDGLWMKNGFWKVTDGMDQYTRNSRIKTMTLEALYAGAEGYRTLGTVLLPDEKVLHQIDLGHAQGVTALRLRIDGIYTGSRFPTDVCVSEVLFVQYEEPSSVR